MKTNLRLILIFSIFSQLALSLHSQDIFEWMAPVPVTDSITFNRNPSGWLMDGFQFGIFYEKSACDSCKPDIWYRNLTTFENERQMVSGLSGYYNPVFYEVNSNEYKGFLFYLSDSSGNLDVFASLIDNDLNIGETTQLTFTAEDEHDLVKSNDLFFPPNRVIGWLCEEKAMIGFFLITGQTISIDSMEVLDSLAVNTLVIGKNLTYFQRKENDSMHLYYRTYEYDMVTGDWSWSETLPLSTMGNNIDLSITGGWNFMANDALWIRDNQVFAFEPDWPGTYQIATYDLPNVRHPSYVGWDMMVKYEGQPHILVYSSSLGDSSEIFGSFGQEYADYDTVRLTHDLINDEKPIAFWGESTNPESNWVYAVWQSHRNGQSPLYYSKVKANIGSGIDEMNTLKISLTTTPNPFHERLEIQLKSHKNEDINLTVFSLSGKIVWQKTVQISNQEIHTYDWNPGKQIPKGMYLIVAEQKGVKVTKRVVYR